MRTLLTTLTLAAGISACVAEQRASPESAVRDSAGIRVVESASPGRISEWPRQAEAAPLLAIRVSATAPQEGPLDPVSVFVGARGEIIVADGNQSGWHRVLVYDSAGRFLRALGGKGEGPCEFQQVWEAFSYPGDSLAVFDMARQRVQIMGIDGSCGSLIPIPVFYDSDVDRRRGFVPAAYGVYPDGDILVSPFGYVSDVDITGRRAYVHRLLRVSPSGEVVRDLGVFSIMDTHANGGPNDHIHFGALAVRGLDGNDLLHGDGRAYEIRRFDSAGALTQIIRRAWRAPRVSRADQEAVLSRRFIGSGGERASGRSPSLARRIRDSNWSETKPPYSSLVVSDSGNVWVEEYRFDNTVLEVQSASTTWSVFDSGGAWSTNVTLPGRFFLRSVTGTRLYGVWQDEAGALEVRVYDLSTLGQ